MTDILTGQVVEGQIEPTDAQKFAKVENHAYAVALHMMYYNFVKLHSKLRVTPAMAAGISDRLWEISDIVALWEAVEPKASTSHARQPSCAAL